MGLSIIILRTHIHIVRLDGGNHLIMNVHSGRNEIQHANLQVEGPTGFKFYVENAKVLTESSSSCQPSNSFSSAPDSMYRSPIVEGVAGRDRDPRSREKRDYRDFNTAFVSVSGKRGNRPHRGCVSSWTWRRARGVQAATADCTDCKEDFGWFTGTGQRSGFLPGQTVSSVLRSST